MRFTEAAKRYARALYEISKSKEKAHKVFDELRAIRQALEQDKVVGEFLKSPSATPDSKKNVLTKALQGKLSEETLNTLLLVCDKGRFELFDQIVSAFESISDADHGVTRGTVRSAAPLSADARKRVEETVSKVTKKKVILSFTEDPKLMGGMVAQVAGWSFDDSLDYHLRNLSDELKRRAQ